AWDKSIASSFSRMYWCDIPRADAFIASMLEPSVAKTWDGLKTTKEDLGMFSIQITAGQRGYYHIVAGLQYSPFQQKEDGSLWRTNVGALVERSPAIVKNHTNGTNEILVEDVNQTIHLIGSTGKILWSRKIDEPILGTVHQVDRFRNGKLQLLFNTADRLYLIDRNGKDVGSFPVRLPEATAVPIAVFDYENDRDARIIVATAEGKIFNFNLDGTEVKGWEKPELGAGAACQVHHLRIKNKDYLIIADQNGQVHIFDRKGSIRERTALTLGQEPSIERIVPGNDIMTSSIFWTDTAGALQQGSFGGPVVPLSPPQTSGSFSSLDIDDDGVLELVRIQDDLLEISGAGRSILQRTFGSPLGSPSKIGKGTIAILRSTEGLVHLLDINGNDLPGSPFEGMLPPVIADLNLDGIPELITVDRNGSVVAYGLPAQSQ
nr:PQQ-like beta-propeller repeat protein [Bacteroidota bacterium]